MAYFKINFHTKPNIERFKENPPIVSSPYYIKSETAPEKLVLNKWYYDKVGGAIGYKLVSIDIIDDVSEKDYESQHDVWKIYL